MSRTRKLRRKLRMFLRSRVNPSPHNKPSGRTGKTRRGNRQARQLL